MAARWRKSPRLLGVHESTISRKVEKITAATRKAILHGLMKRGMSRKEAEQTMEVEVTELSVDVRRRLVQEKGGKPFHNRKAGGSTQEARTD